MRKFLQCLKKTGDTVDCWIVPNTDSELGVCVDPTTGNWVVLVCSEGRMLDGQWAHKNLAAAAAEKAWLNAHGAIKAGALVFDALQVTIQSVVQNPDQLASMRKKLDIAAEQRRARDLERAKRLAAKNAAKEQ